EFSSAEGICHGTESELAQLIFNKIERPVIAQIYGSDPDAFFHVAQLICKLGFDGLDINMGCPAKKVSSRGCGAGLIKDPLRAKASLRATRNGIRAWADGAPLSILKLHPKIADWYLHLCRVGILSLHPGSNASYQRRMIPVSLKTRLGIDKIVIKEWVQRLLEEEPATISIHGRTLAQGYRGAADWDAIAKAVETARGSGTMILGNGDLTSMDDAFWRIRQSGVDGVLLGRAAFGNPWVFRNKAALRQAVTKSSLHQRKEEGTIIQDDPVPLEERFRVALEHARLFQETHGRSRFVGMRKHLGWYCRGFQGARAMRARMVHVNGLEEVEAILSPHLGQLTCA
ncbi:MAG: tRNA dihydrouridine synthase, partial [Nitrospiria bacterium]